MPKPLPLLRVAVSAPRAVSQGMSHLHNAQSACGQHEAEYHQTVSLEPGSVTLDQRAEAAIKRSWCRMMSPSDADTPFPNCLGNKTASRLVLRTPIVFLTILFSHIPIRSIPKLLAGVNGCLLSVAEDLSYSAPCNFT